MAVRDGSTPVLDGVPGLQVGLSVAHSHVPRVPLSGRRVRLRAVVASDYDFLFVLAADERTGPHWRYRGLPPRPEEFVRDLWQGVLVQFLVERIDTNERVGLVVAYEANLRDGYCHLGALFRAEMRVWPLEAMLLFVNFLFEEFGFIKLYSHVIDYNLDTFRSVVGRWMECEGVLRDHERHGGRRCDLHILALWRDRFERDRERLLMRVTEELPP